jgi:hypothetical protein
LEETGEIEESEVDVDDSVMRAAVNMGLVRMG